MTAIEHVAVVVVAIWLATLSFVLLLVVRQIGLVTVRLNHAARYSDVDADDDGLKIGALVPLEVSELVGGNGGTSTFLFLSATCATCRSVAQQVGARHAHRDTLFLIGGDRAGAKAVGELLPDSAERFFDPDVSRLADALQIESVPFGIRVVGDTVVAKAYLHTAEDIARVAGGNGTGDTATAQEAIEVIPVAEGNRQ